jgi:hypothetical protein
MSGYDDMAAWLIVGRVRRIFAVTRRYSNTIDMPHSLPTSSKSIALPPQSMAYIPSATYRRKLEYGHSLADDTWP